VRDLVRSAPVALSKNGEADAQHADTAAE
jgi:hypothetical protein